MERSVENERIGSRRRRGIDRLLSQFEYEHCEYERARAKRVAGGDRVKACEVQLAAPSSWDRSVPGSIPTLCKLRHEREREIEIE
jgi:hypothetical protein